MARCWPHFVKFFDGFWERNVGSDGGKSLGWSGRIVIIGAVTTAWDSAHAIIALMGDRFVLVRVDTTAGRFESGMQALHNVGHEVEMRQELKQVVGGLVGHASTDEAALTLTEEEMKRLLRVADVVTLARTAVEKDYRSEVIDAHAPEAPMRFAKQLAQLVRGGMAIGMAREAAMRLAIRCARDSIAPLRLKILLDLANEGDSEVKEVVQRINKPYRTTKRELEALTALQLVVCEEVVEEKRRRTVYNLAEGFDGDTLLALDR